MNWIFPSPALSGRHRICPPQHTHAHPPPQCPSPRHLAPNQLPNLLGVGRGGGWLKGYWSGGRGGGLESGQTGDHFGGHNPTGQAAGLVEVVEGEHPVREVLGRPAVGRLHQRLLELIPFNGPCGWGPCRPPAGETDTDLDQAPLGAASLTLHRAQEFAQSTARCGGG